MVRLQTSGFFTKNENLIGPNKNLSKEECSCEFPPQKGGSLQSWYFYSIPYIYFLADLKSAVLSEGSESSQVIQLKRALAAIQDDCMTLRLKHVRAMSVPSRKPAYLVTVHATCLTKKKWRRMCPIRWL